MTLNGLLNSNTSGNHHFSSKPQFKKKKSGSTSPVRKHLQDHQQPTRKTTKAVTRIST